MEKELMTIQNSKITDFDRAVQTLQFFLNKNKVVGEDKSGSQILSAISKKGN